MANEIQRLEQSPSAIYGDLYLTFDGETTAGMDFNNHRSATEVENRLEVLSNIGSGNVSCTQIDVDIINIEFVGAMANTNVPQIVPDGSALRQEALPPSLTVNNAGAGPSINSTTITPNYVNGTESTNAVLTLTFSPQPNMGTWYIGNFYDYDYNISASDGSWNISGSPSSGTVTITYGFVGEQTEYSNYNNIDLEQLTSEGSAPSFTVTPSSDATDGEIAVTLSGNTIHFANDATQSEVETAMSGVITNYTVEGDGPYDFVGTTAFLETSYTTFSYSSNPLRKPMTIVAITTIQEGGVTASMTVVCRSSKKTLRIM